MKNPVRILFVAFDAATLGFDISSEIRDISSLPNCHTTLLNGSFTKRDVFTYARAGYDIIHYVTHGNEEGVVLPSGEVLNLQDMATVNRIAGASACFINSCETSKPSSYIVSNGGRWSIHGNVKIEDKSAWKMPLAFYSALDGAGGDEIVAALKVADDRTGNYGFAISAEYLSDWIDNAHTSTIHLQNWQLIMVAISVIISVMLSLAAIAGSVM